MESVELVDEVAPRGNGHSAWWEVESPAETVGMLCGRHSSEQSRIRPRTIGKTQYHVDEPHWLVSMLSNMPVGSLEGWYVALGGPF